MSELSIAKAIISRGLAAGYQVSVWEGEGYALRYSRDIAAIMEALQSTDEDVIHFSQHVNEGKGAFRKYLGWVMLVWGNGEDVVADHSYNEVIDRLVG